MTLLITPVTSLISTSPISAFDNRNVIVPIISNNPLVQKTLEDMVGNKISSGDIFKSELNSNRDVVVPITSNNYEVDKKLSENGGNSLNIGSPIKDTNSNVGNQSSNNILNNSFSDRIAFNKNQLEIPLNDNVAAFTALSPVTSTDTKLPLESVVNIQDSRNVTAPVASLDTRHQLDAYSYMINAFQSGFNNAFPTAELDNHVDFDA